MLARILGALVFTAGVILGLKLLGAAALGLVGLVGLVLKVLLVAGLSYLGWRWVTSPTALAKVAGACLLVVGTVASLPLLAGMVAEAAGLVWLLVRGAFAGVLIYAGWRWLNCRSLGTAQR